jgi:hypothetical protein
MTTHADIDHRMTFHPVAGPAQAEKYEKIRAAGREFAHLIADLVPYSDERSNALTRIDEAIMWANAGVARNEGSIASDLWLTTRNRISRSLG